MCAWLKTPNEIFACHRLAMRCQEPGESIDQFLVALKKLAKDCNFQAVTAEVYRSELVLDSFISSLSSSYIRQRHLEHNTLTQEEAYRQALALESAQMKSNAYNPTPQVAAFHTSLKPDNVSEESNSENIAKPGPSNSTIAAADSAQKNVDIVEAHLIVAIVARLTKPNAFTVALLVVILKFAVEKEALELRSARLQ